MFEPRRSVLHASCLFTCLERILPACAHKLAGVSILALGLEACGAVPRVSVEMEQRPVTSEEATSVELSVALSRRPSGVISVEAVSSNEAEGRVSDAVRFDARNWQEPQIIRVTGQDDLEDDGDVPYDVTLYATSSKQPDLPPRLVKVVHLINLDDEVARFDALDDLPGGEFASYVSDLSASGAIVVGWSVSSEGDVAIRWTPRGGLQALGGQDGQAHTVSPNGEWIAGSVAASDPPSSAQGRAAVRWQSDGSYERLRSAPASPGNPQDAFSLTEGSVALDDGRVFTTCFQLGVFFAIGCRFDAPGQVSPIAAQAFGADADNNYAGRLNGNRYDPFVHMVFNQTRLPYVSPACLPPTGCTGEARDFADDHSVIVGTSQVPSVGADPNASGAPLFDTGWVYSEANGAQRLPDLEGGDEATGAFAVSRDGRIAVGFGTDEGGRQAVIWIDEAAPVPIADLLRDQDGELPEGWTLLEVRALSSDSRTFAGNAINPAGRPEGFRIVLQASP